MFTNLTSDQIIFFAILIVTLTLLISEKIRKDLVALLIVFSLYITGLLTSQQALSGFSSEPAIGGFVIGVHSSRTTTAIMLPITLNLARQRKIAASKRLMPMSFAASL